MKTELMKGDSFKVNDGNKTQVMIVEKILDGIVYCKSGDLTKIGKWRVETILNAINNGKA